MKACENKQLSEMHGVGEESIAFVRVVSTGILIDAILLLKDWWDLNV